jgi:predicted AAA+ superfamily ATPase
MADELIQRKTYLDQLIQWKEKQLIKVVTGVRRCGKSTLLSLYMDYLKECGVGNEQIVFINLDSIENEGLLDYLSLYRFLKEKLCKNTWTYIFIDEIQNCGDFEKAVGSLFLEKGVDLYITGSNAYLLSGELATLLSGRYVEIAMLPLSFAEYSSFVPSADKRRLLQDYLEFGSFPYVARLEKNAALIKSYLEGIYNTILIKDVAKREQIGDISLLENIIRFLSHSIGSPISSKKISDTLNSAGRKISVNTVETYLHALTRSFAFYKVNRFDIRGKQHLKTLGKYYIVDTGIRNMLLSGSSADLGHLLENIVYFELLRRGGKVSIGKFDEREIDFVSLGDEAAYYQVSASVLDPNTLKRELEGLQKIADNHPKYLLTLDDVPHPVNYEGIRHLNIVDWLLLRPD